MTIGKFFLYLVLFVVFAPILYVVTAFIDVSYINAYRFQYRLTVEVDVDGETKSGSSLYGVVAPTKSRLPILLDQFNTNPQVGVYGVSPLIDLGRYGTLVAAQDYNFSHYIKTLKERGQAVPDYSLNPTRPIWPSKLPYYAYTPRQAGDVSWPEPHRTVAQQRNRIQSKRMPPFIWIPPSGNFREARQLMPDQFADVIGPGVKLKAVWIEPTLVFWVPTSYDKTPKWLDDLYSEQARLRKLSTKELRKIEQPPHVFELGSEMITGTRWR